MTTAASPSHLRTEIAATLRLAGPLALANLLQMAVYATDVIFVARLGDETLAASSLAVSLFGLLIWSCTALTGAVSPLIAAELGQRKHAVREVRRSVRMALWLAVLCTAVGMIACQFGGAVMLATGQNPRIAAHAQGFLTVLSLSILPTIIGNVLRSFVSAIGRPIYATIITALAIAANAVGNYAFVYGHLGVPALGLNGSALSTLLTTSVMLAAYLVAIYTDRHLRRYRVLGRWWRPEWSRLRELWRIGLPIALTVVAEAGLFGSAAFLMGRLGPAQLAAHAIALQLAAAFFQIPLGIGQAVTIRVGYHFGAGDRVAVARAGNVALIVCVVTQALAAAVMMLVPRLVLAIYIDVGAAANTGLVALATRYLIVAAAFQLFDGVQAVAAGALRGLQDTRVPMVMALAGYWPVGFVLALWLGLFTPWAGVGVWLGLMAGLAVVSVLLLWRWHWRERLRLTGPHTPG
ncbi:MAG: MATE family efflux transporter [Novosphingobium sp.]